MIKEHKGIVKNNFWLLNKIWKYAPEYIIGTVIEGVIWGINHTITILYTQKLFELLGKQVIFIAIAKLIVNYAIYLLIFYLFHFWYWEIYNPKVQEKLQIALHSDMFKQAVRIDLESYDSPEFYNNFVWAMDQSFPHAISLVEDTGKLINRIVAAIVLSGVLFSVDGTMAIVILGLAIIRIGLTLIMNNMTFDYKREINPLERKENYINRVFKLADYAKELRITHICRPLFRAYNNNIEQEKKIITFYGGKLSFFQSIRDSIASGGEIGLIIYMLYKVMVTRDLGLGSFAVAINSCWKMSWFLGDMVERIMKYHEHGIFIEKMKGFMQCSPKIKNGSYQASAFDSLILKNLKFGYSHRKAEKYVINDISMEIHKGDKIAIVGYNGAGKTTFTKLLLRLYEADKGEIIYNGKNINEYTVDSYRKNIAAVFQDYRIFACTLGENVVGGKKRSEDTSKIQEALNKSTFCDRMKTLQAGIDTVITREFDNTGIQLSGGEQQKVAIARAFYKDADFIILDEPSSSLDPDAEYELNQAISSYAEDKTVVFISHRLSTTKNADRIYMFDKGEIVECGTHNELMRANGKYAYMFNLQAKRYKE